ncbi:unnamed protein product [Brachionus calyciflorus]|uniref:Poly(A)-specific ribonuclease RNA-binding domain-containing protein n=1 Tax=Brachionus calyciflorus TaxID=104777 RepID=A0A813RD16_9BILA|nr:unnamed protein product [Brachionus calyciflorus]
MDVTIDNYEELLPEILEKIENCDFCSIDCELSGITQYKDLNSFDTLRTRYEKIKNSVESFLILQFGLCVFKYKPNEKSYESHAYNCYLFPRSQKCKYSKDYSFSCLNSSVEFLIEQNFDFNKVFKKGISFISKDCEENLRHKLHLTIEDRKIPKNTLYPPNKEDIRDQIDKILNEIDEFVENKLETRKEIKFTEFLLRLFIEKNIRQKYSKQLKYESKFLENKERLMIITKVDPKDITNEIDDFEKEIGFSKLIWFLSQSNKLIVGHNMISDIMQMLRQFFTANLPENFEDFKSMTNSLFPRLLDTKYMASQAPLKDLINNTTLADLERILSKEPFPKITIENDLYSTNNEKLHEAGYDAYLTGCCYAKMFHYLETFNSSKLALEEFYSNKLYLMKSYDNLIFDLKKVQEEPKRDNVFYVEFPPKWETQDLYDLFSSYGPIFIGWINERSAFVALQNNDNVKKVASQLLGVCGRDYRVYFYSTYINQLYKSKNEKNKNSNSTPDNKNSDNNLTNSNEKRKRNKEKQNDKSSGSDSSLERKKFKSDKNDEKQNDKPFEQSMDCVYNLFLKDNTNKR